MIKKCLFIIACFCISELKGSDSLLGPLFALDSNFSSFDDSVRYKISYDSTEVVYEGDESKEKPPILKDTVEQKKKGF